jgi:hypothetical protein
MNSYRDNASISFVFYTGQGASEPLINRLTSMWTGRYMHCELVFSQPGGRNLSCGVWQGETVFLRHKTFGKDCWVWRSLSLPAKHIQTIKAFCKLQADNKIPFNKSGLLRCTTPFPRPSDGKAWFCSELCVAALQTIGMFTNEVPSAVTPSYLYDLLGQIDSYANASPLVAQRIASKSLRFNFRKK